MSKVKRRDLNNAVLSFRDDALEISNINEYLSSEILERILIELRISNAYNAIGYGETITEEDLE